MDIYGLTVKDLEDKTKIHHTSLYAYLEGDFIPSLNSAVKIADLFGCSFDFLFGFSESFINRKYVCSGNINERLKIMIDKRGLSRYKVAQLTRVSQNQVCNWYHGKTVPKLASLVILAEVLECSLDYLAGRDEI